MPAPNLPSRLPKSRSRRAEATPPRPSRVALRLEGLEVREVPAVFAVDGLADAVAADGQLTLREAISLHSGALAVNQLSAAEQSRVVGPIGTDDRIVFVTTGTIALGGALPTLTGTLTIAGPGAGSLTVDGGHQFRLLTVAANATAVVSGLRLSRGHDATSGGGVLNNGTLTLSEVEVDGNTTDTHGGAVENNGVLQVDRSYFHDNAAAKVGGAIDNNATAAIAASTLANNSAGNTGGAVWSGGTLAVTNSTITSNHAANAGGGVRLTAGTAAVASSTITGNEADSDGTGGDLGGGISVSGGTLTLNNTVVAQNVRNLQTAASDVAGAAGGQFNFVGAGTDLTGLTNGTGGNAVGTAATPLDPVLGPPAATGGLAPTRVPGPTSPLLGVGAPLALAGATDQRGVARAAGASTVGAVEVAVAPTISDVPDQADPGGPIPFVVGDAQTPAGQLQVAAVASNPSLFPPGSVLVGGTGASRTVTLTPAAGQTGAAVITLVVTDGGGRSAVDTFTVTITPHPAATPEVYAVGAGPAGGNTVRVYNPDGTPKADVPAFEDDVSGGVRTATADVTGDGVADLIVGTGPGTVAEVRVFDGATGQRVRTTLPFADFQGGVFVAAADFNNDGFDDVVITPDEGGGPRVSIYSGKDGAVLSNFFAIDDPNFRGGARAAAGDVNGDGTPDLVVSAGFGGGPRIAVYDGTNLGGTPTRLMNDFFAFEPGLRNGAYVAAGDLNGDGKADLIFGGGPGGAPRVLALDAGELLAGQGVDGSVLANFFAGNTAGRGGVRVAVKNLDGDAFADLITGDGAGSGSGVRGYLGPALAAVAFAFDAYPGFSGGIFVG